MIYYRKTLFGIGPKLTAVQSWSALSIKFATKLHIAIEFISFGLFSKNHPNHHFAGKSVEIFKNVEIYWNM
jgi:hypothetical protein